MFSRAAIGAIKSHKDSMEKSGKESQVFTKQVATSSLLKKKQEVMDDFTEPRVKGQVVGVTVVAAQVNRSAEAGRRIKLESYCGETLVDCR